MENMFSKDNMISLDLSSFNANKVTTMKYMFYLCTELQSIIGLDTINANSLTGNGINSIFQTCRKITSLDLSGLNVSNITELQNICDGCSALEYINITGWNTSKVTTLYKAFTDCKALVTIDGVLDLSGVKNGLYPGSSTHLFANCSSLETLYLKNIYKDITVTNASKFSIDLGATKVKDECLVYIIDQLPNLADKGVTNNTAIKLTLPTVNTLTDEQKQVALDKGWIVVN
jgi:surface protein